MSSSLSSKASYNGLHHMSSQTLRLRSFSGWLASYGAPAETLVITSSFINKYNMRTSCNSDLRLQIFPSTAAASGTATTSNEQRSLSKSGTATTNGENGRLLDTNKHPDTILKRQIRSKIVGISEEHVRTADSRFRSHNDRNTTNTSNCIVGALASAAPQHQNQSLPSIEPLRSFAPCNSAAAALKLHTSDAGATVMGTTSNRIDASAAASNAGSDSTVLPGPAAAAAVPASESGISHATPVRRHLPFQGTFMWRARRPARSTQPLNGVGSGSGSVGGKRTALTAAAARDGGHVPPVSRTYKPIRSSPGQTASSRTRDMSTRNINSSTRCRSVSRSSAPARSINTSHSRMPLEDSNRSSSSSSSSSIKNRESCNGGNVPQVPKAQVQEELPNDATIRTRQVTKAATAAAAASTSSSDSSSSAVATELQGNGRRRAFHRTPGAVAAAAVATATSTGGAATTAKRTSDDVMRITNGGNQMPRISVTASSSRTATEISPGSGRSRAFTATAGDGAASSSSIDCSSSSAPGSKGPYPRTSRGHLHPQNRFSRGASRSAQQQRDNPWSIRCTPIDMEATYPSLVSFAAAVRSQAASSWHPLVISAALNHATKMMETLDRRKMAPELQEGIGSDDRRNFDTEDEKTANPGSRDTFSPPSPQHAPVPAFGSNSREGSYPDEKIIREILDILYDAYLPYVRTTINSRYVINALWVCAKTGYWGAPGHRLVPALFARLRHDNYTLLCRSDGQAHGILWWALSQCDAQQQQQQKNGAVAVAAVRGEGRGRTGLSKGQAVANGRSTSNETRPPTAAAAAATRVAAAAGPTAEGGGGAGGGGGSPLVSGCMDLLRLSASIIKKSELLSVGFKPQEFSNIIIAAARLQYMDDQRLIDHLLTHMVKHPGPFKPQAISNTIYGLGELYGNKQELYGSTAVMEVVDKDEDDSNNGESEQNQGDPLEGKEEEKLLDGRGQAADGQMETEASSSSRDSPHNNDSGCGDGFGAEDKEGIKLETEGSRVAAAAAREEAGPSGGLPVSLAGHIRSLVGLALKLGLHSFSPQELSNMIYGLARLGLRMQGAAAAGSTPPSPSAAAAADSDGDGDGDGQSGHGDSAAAAAAAAGVDVGSADPDTAAREFVVRLEKHVRQRLQPSCTRSSPRPFDPQSLSNITWALTVIGHADQSYFTVAVHAALYGGCMDDACPQEWVILLWTLASRTHRPPPELLHLLHSRLYGGAPWTSEDQQNAWPILLWSLSMLDLYDEDVVSWISNAVSPSNIAKLDAQRLATCLFSLAAMPEGVLSRHAAFVEELVAAANLIETQEYGAIGCIQLWQFHLELLATTNGDQLSSAAGGSAAASSTAQSSLPRDRPRRTSRRRMTSSDATGTAASTHTYASAASGPTAAATANSMPPAHSPPALRRHHRPALSPVLVAAARDALLRRNARISSATASSLQLSVYSHLRMIQLNQLQAQNAAVAAATAAAHNHQQQLQQPQEAERQRQCPRHEEVKQDQQQQQQGFKGRKTSRSVLVLTSSHNMSTTSISTTAAATTATAAATSISTASNPGVGSSFTPTSSCSPLDSSGESGEREETADAAPLAATATRRKRGRRRRERADESCINSCSGAAAIASATDAVVRVLRVEQEWLVEALALRVDVCLWLSDGRQVVVEVDGPSHYFANLLRTQRPKTALRNRQLSRVFGAENVKCVPYWEWEVTAGVEARTAYLSRLLGLRGPE